MFICSLIKVFKLCLVYFGVDKSICIVSIKKLRTKDIGELFIDIMLERRVVVIFRNDGKLLGVMVIVLDGKWFILLFNVEFLFLFLLVVRV